MTAQVSDTFLYESITYRISGICGKGLFDPSEQGIEIVPCSTAMWRGYCCIYILQDGLLLLQDVGLCCKGDPPIIFGISPAKNEMQDAAIRGHWQYRGMGWNVPFSGGLLLGTGFIEALYVHMGFHPAWKYQQVHELIFENGRLTESFDRSQAMKEYRDRMKDLPLEPGTTNERELTSWIQRCFSLDYER